MVHTANKRRTTTISLTKLDFSKLSVRVSLGEFVYFKLLICLWFYLIGIIDTISSIFDYPFYHIQVIMGYWPLYNNVLASMWSILDNNMNWLTNITMAYMSYARLRSIQSPNKFTNEMALKRPRLVIATFWILGFCSFTIILVFFGTQPNSASIDYEPRYLKSFVDLVIWFTPLSVITVISVIFFAILKKRAKKKHQIQKTFRSSKLSSHTRFLLMMFVFWIQWFIPCILDLISPTNWIRTADLSQIYWLTFTVNFCYLVHANS